MFHQVEDDPPPERVGWGHELETSSSFLEQMVITLRKRGYTFLSIDEVKDVLSRADRHAPKFVVVTFDDGYAHVHDKAFPLLTSMSVPFTVYLTTGYPDHTIVHYWYLLEEALLGGARLSFEHERERYTFAPHDSASRERAFASVDALFASMGIAAQRELASRIFDDAMVADRVEKISLSWAEVQEMAAHPLVTIGAHTVSHPNLRQLSRDAALHEMVESKRRIEARIGHPVRHFAYPFGAWVHANVREFELARESGFETATTTSYPLCPSRPPFADCSQFRNGSTRTAAPTKPVRSSTAWQ